MPEATACPPSVVADTIMRTIELGVMITDAAVDEKQTTIFCSPVARDRAVSGLRPGRPLPRHRDPAADRSAGGRLPAGAAGCGAALPLHNASSVGGRCSIRISGSWRPRARRRRGAVPVCVAAVDDRPHHHRSDRRRTRCLLATNAPKFTRGTHIKLRNSSELGRHITQTEG